MTEWVILLLFVPAVVVPVVLLFGFAGCDIVFGLERVPSIASAEGTGARTITVSWQFGGGATSFQIEQTRVLDETRTVLEAPSSPFAVPGLKPANTYRFRVRAIFSDDDPSDWSAPALGTTRVFDPLAGDEADWQGHCLVQRIEPGRLSNSGTQVKITIRASSIEAASIDRIYISQPAAAGDPYDSAADLTAVPMSQIIVPADTALVLGPVNYSLDETKPLLIAFDFSPMPGSGIAYLGPVLPDDGVAYYVIGAEAAIRDRRAGYIPVDRIYLVERIEVE